VIFGSETCLNGIACRLGAFMALVMTTVLLAGTAQAKFVQVWDSDQQKMLIYNTDDPGNTLHSFIPIPRQTIAYTGPYGPNTIVVNTKDRRLTYVMDGGQAEVYGIGVGREGFTWSGTDRVSRKAEWPGWTPPAVMIARERAQGVILPAYMKGGEDNPLGARALYIGARIYRIHGTAEPWTIGHAVSSGCIRLTNDDIIDLYDRVAVGTKVVVLN
jgi:lipoprotein-anchoring transpeptidase ErfK/SrfK